MIARSKPETKRDVSFYFSVLAVGAFCFAFALGVDGRSLWPACLYGGAVEILRERKLCGPNESGHAKK